jgi:cation diffusion facilitator family transporter
MADCGCELEVESTAQARVLWAVLAINAAMFVAEFSVGVVAESTALIADSLDMLADAFVYAVSLYAVSRSAQARVSAARLSGYLQLGLGILVLVEVLRRLLGGSSPEPIYMVAASTLALFANVICLKLIAAHRDGGVHMRASFIFSQNDVIANVAVVLSGLLVALSGLAWWDSLAGAGIGILILSGGVRILSEAKAATTRASATANIAAQQGVEPGVK